MEEANVTKRYSTSSLTIHWMRTVDHERPLNWSALTTRRDNLISDVRRRYCWLGLIALGASVYNFPSIIISPYLSRLLVNISYINLFFTCPSGKYSEWVSRVVRTVGDSNSELFLSGLKWLCGWPLREADKRSPFLKRISRWLPPRSLPTSDHRSRMTQVIVLGSGRRTESKKDEN